jgi:histone H3/H4
MARTQQIQHATGSAFRQKVDAQKAAKRAKRAAELAAAAAAEAEAEARRAAEAEEEEEEDEDDDYEADSNDDDVDDDDDEEEEEEEEEEEMPPPKPSKKAAAAATAAAAAKKKPAVQTKAHAAKTKNVPVVSKKNAKPQPAPASTTRVLEKKPAKKTAPAPQARSVKKPPQVEVFTKTRANGTETKMKRITTFLANGKPSVVERPLRRFHAGTVALRRIREFQRHRTQPCIKRLPLKRFFLEKVQNYSFGGKEYRIQRRAMLLCQEAVESFLIRLVRDSLEIIASMTNKQTLTADSIYTTALLKYASMIPDVNAYKSQKLPARSQFAQLKPLPQSPCTV